MRLKHKPEDFVVREAYHFEPTRRGRFYVYLMDKQKLSTFEAVGRIAKAHRLQIRDISYCGLKDKQGRTEQIIAVEGARVDMQEPDLRLKFLGRTADRLSSANLRANRFVITVRDLTTDEAKRVPASLREVRYLGIVNYFDSQRFGSLKHGQGLIARHLVRGDVEAALRAYLATPSKLDRSEDAKVKAFWRDHWGEWSARCPFARGRDYDRIIRKLREDSKDFVGAFTAIEKRKRGMVIFEYQSFLWNEAVRRYLITRFGRDPQLVFRYQAGTLVFPRNVEHPDEVKRLRKQSFPLVAADSVIEDADIKAAVEFALLKEHVTLADLQLECIPQMGFRHEERRLVIRPNRMSVVNPRPDEMHPGRVKITLAFTLPPGAYASLVARRVMWFAMSDVVSAGGEIPEPDESFVGAELDKEVQSRASRAVHRRHRRPRPVRGIAARDADSRKTPRRTAGKKSAPERGKKSPPERGKKSAPDRGKKSAPDRGKKSAPGEGTKRPPRGGKKRPPPDAKKSAPRPRKKSVPRGGKEGVSRGKKKPRPSRDR